MFALVVAIIIYSKQNHQIKKRRCWLETKSIYRIMWRFNDHSLPITNDIKKPKGMIISIHASRSTSYHMLWLIP
jgi:hypothetical protein